MNEKELGQIAVKFFQKNDFGWIPTDQGGHVLGVRAGEPPRPLIVTRCLAEGGNSIHCQMRLWAKDANDIETITGICAFLLFGDYDTLFDEHGQPIFIEALEETKKEMEPHYKTVKKFQEIQAASTASQKEMEDLMRRQADEDGEGWKYGG